MRIDDFPEVDASAPDLGALAAHLEAHLDGFRGPIALYKFADGQSNPTFQLTAASGTYVLRRQPPGELLKSAHAVDREFRVLRALARSDVPVPAVHYLCEDRSVIGSMFYIMELCDGRVFWDAALPDVDRSARTPIYQEVVRVLAALHKVDIDDAGLGDFGKAGNYFDRQFSRWSRQYRDSEIQRIPAMEELMARLNTLLPKDDGRVALVHGDYRVDNLVFDHHQPSVRAVLDWELSTLGHPFADVGYLCMLLRMPAGVGKMSGLRGQDPDHLGIPSEQQLVAQYCREAKISGIKNFSFYIAFSFFRLASIIQGVAKRSMQGNASSRQASAVGGYTEPVAKLGLEAIT